MNKYLAYQILHTLSDILNQIVMCKILCFIYLFLIKVTQYYQHFTLTNETNLKDLSHRTERSADCLYLWL